MADDDMADDDMADDDMADSGADHDQSDLFRGVSSAADLSESLSVKGTPAARMPAFVPGEELADLADRDPRIVVMTVRSAAVSLAAAWTSAVSRG
jgi:hypothetical protein